MKTIALPVLLALVAGSVVAQPRPPLPRGPSDNVNYAYADVLRVDPFYEIVRFTEPREECVEQPVRYRERGEQPIGGTVLGAIIGGVLGSQVGSGSGRDAATVAGAVAGGAVGRSADRRNSSPDRIYEDVETRCRTIEVERSDRRIAGYDVEYQYKGDVYFSRLDYDPGSKLRVRVSVEPAD
jgi:uncharacterized protein YcfJ